MPKTNFYKIKFFDLGEWWTTFACNIKTKIDNWPILTSPHIFKMFLKESNKRLEEKNSIIVQTIILASTSNDII